MKKWLLVGLLSLLILVVVFKVRESDPAAVSSEPMQPEPSIYISNPPPTTTPTTLKEIWFTGLSDPEQMNISTMEDGMQRMYEPVDRLFFNSPDATIDFYYRDVPNLTLNDIAKIKAGVTVTAKTDQQAIPFTVTAFNELNSQGIAIHLNKVPQADLVVQFRAMDGSALKEFTFEYMPLFTYEIHSPEEKDAEYYAKQSGTLFRMPPDQTYTYQVHFSLDVNQTEALKLLQAQFNDLDWSSEWKGSRDLIITLRTRPEDIAKQFLIHFYGVKSTEGYVITSSQALHGVIREPKVYEAVNVATGKVSTLFTKQPQYQKLDLSPNKQFYLATEPLDDFQGEYPVASVSLLDSKGDVIKRFANMGNFAHWLPDGRSFVYVSDSSILSYTPETDVTKVIWTSPYKGIKTFYSSFDGLEVDPQTGRMIVSINRLPGLEMEKGVVELYLFDNVNDPSPRHVKKISERGNSSFGFQFDGKYVVYTNYYVAGEGDESRWESKQQWLDWKSLKIKDITGIAPTSYLTLLAGGEALYLTGDNNYYEWFRYNLESEQSRSLFTAEHGIDVAWWIGNGQYMIHDFTGTYKFNLEKLKFANTPLLPEKAEILGSQANTIIYLRNPDPLGGN
ncbi:hypothetical protein EHS13_34225 [Paenibacillus psychroresistens]|uniref:Uncharacterized protein n=1 Tax=Paenibacillus psychroresistens TaxID=1778678 RepID=A0A6B8RSX2_9BACL|nr:hypothetical protein [Paenibacillus psychroresistens]QGQ99561.1 hypothetical protein EHS13_34225 [Paenibacillus psychroresistens]